MNLKLKIKSKSEFIHNFLIPISKIELTPEIQLVNNKLTCISDADGDIFIFAMFDTGQHICDEICNIVIPELTNFIKALSSIDKEQDDIELEINGNHIFYKSPTYNFKYFLFEKTLKKSFYTAFEKIGTIKYNCGCKLTRDDIKKVMKLLPLVSDTSKMYIFTKDKKIFTTLSDKKIDNSNEFNMLLSEDVRGSIIDNIVITFSLFRTLYSLHIDSHVLKVTNEFKHICVISKFNNGEIKYVVPTIKQ
jgi:hypothetical protein